MLGQSPEGRLGVAAAQIGVGLLEKTRLALEIGRGGPRRTLRLIDGRRRAAT
jgi:hypothetical protein